MSDLDNEWHGIVPKHTFGPFKLVIDEGDLTLQGTLNAKMADGETMTWRLADALVAQGDALILAGGYCRYNDKVYTLVGQRTQTPPVEERPYTEGTLSALILMEEYGISVVYHRDHNRWVAGVYANPGSIDAFGRMDGTMHSVCSAKTIVQAVRMAAAAERLRKREGGW